MALNIWKIAICLIMGLVAVHAQSSYCQLCPDHTLCLYRGTSSSCNTVIRRQLTNAEKGALVNIHNTYRSKVARGLETRGLPGPQPSASNMRMMNWNNELATIAQTWANQCAFGHDTCRKTCEY
nr:unnamed protein product [Timema californicum]